MRSACLLEFCATRAPVHLLTFAEKDQPDPRQALPRGLVEKADVIRLPHHRRDPLSRSARNLRRLALGRPPLLDRFSGADSLHQAAAAITGRSYALAVVEHFWAAPYLPVLRPHTSQIVLDLHNVESALHSSSAGVEPFPQSWAHRLFASRTRRIESETFGKFDQILTTSHHDARRVREIASTTRPIVAPNSLPMRDAPRTPEREMIAFSGNFEYHPNAAAVRFFANRIWPALRERFPTLVWRLIGKNEGAFRAMAAADPRIELSGPVDDALDELARARVVVAPLLSGSGTRVKIIEAWAASRAVVSTPIGAEGLPFVEESNILLAESPDRWLQQVSRLLQDRLLRNQLGAEGRKTYESSCSWPAVWRILEESFGPFLSPAPAAKVL